MPQYRIFGLSVRAALTVLVFIVLAGALAYQAMEIADQRVQIDALTENLADARSQRDQLVRTVHQMTDLQIRIMSSPRWRNAAAVGQVSAGPMADSPVEADSGADQPRSGVDDPR